MLTGDWAFQRSDSCFVIELYGFDLRHRIADLQHRIVRFDISVLYFSDDRPDFLRIVFDLIQKISADA